MESTLQDLKERRSIRSFTNEQIKEEDLAKILEAATYAPSGSNKQTAKIVVVQNQAEIAYLSKLNASYSKNPGGDPFYGAPTVIVVLGDGTKANYVKDASLVLGNMMNAAHALGVGSCWINRADNVFASDEGKALLKKWGIDAKYEGVGHCILGYPKGDIPKAKPRKEDYITYIR